MNTYINYGRMILKDIMNESVIFSIDDSLDTQYIIESNHLNLLLLSKYSIDILNENERKKLLIAKLDYKKNSSSLQNVICKLESADIDYRIIKGILIADTYPQAYSRLFGDHDILVRKCDLDKALLVIDTCSYHMVEDLITTKDISLVKNNYKKLELHFDIADKINSMTEKIHDLIWKSCYEYYIDGYLIKGPTPSTHLIYIVFHILKHFNNTGFGLRHLIDLKYFIEKHKINLIEVDAFFQKYGYEKFFRSLMMICVDELKLNFDYLSLGWKRSENLQEELFEYVLRTGTFGKGSKDNILTSMYERNMNGNTRSNKWIIFFRFMFPSKHSLISQYPLLKKGSFFLPIAWCSRWIKQLFSKNYNFKEKIFAFTIDKSLLNSKLYLIKELGLRNYDEQ